MTKASRPNDGKLIEYTEQEKMVTYTSDHI